MTTRGARRRRTRTSRVTLRRRFQLFLRSWEAMIALSVLVVISVLAAGIFRLTLPFDFLKPPPAPDPWGTFALPAGTPAKLVYIGNVQGMSIDAAGTRQAVELALKERGTVKEATVELSVVEDRCDAGQASARAVELANGPSLLGVISHACPASTLAAKAAFEEARVPYFSLNSTEPGLTVQGTMNTFRMAWNQKQQARDAARYARRDLRLGRGLFLHDGTPDNEAVASAVRDEFRRARGTVVDLRPVSAGEVEGKRAAVQAKEMNADFLFFAGAPPAALSTLTALKGSEFTGKWMASDALQRDPAYNAAGALLEGTLATTLQNPRADRYALWKEGYEKEYGPAGDFSAEAYDAASLLMVSAEAIGVKRDNRLEIGKQRLVSVLRVYPFDGLAGRSGFDANGDRNQVLRVVLKYESGEWKQVQVTPPVPGEESLPPGDMAAPTVMPDVPPDMPATEEGEGLP